MRDYQITYTAWTMNVPQYPMPNSRNVNVSELWTVRKKEIGNFFSDPCKAPILADLQFDA